MDSKHCFIYREQWEHVQLSRLAVKARARLMIYTVLVSVPFILLLACLACLCGLRLHEVTGAVCYYTMVTLIFIFDSLRNAAHAAFAEACEDGLVILQNDLPVISPDCRHRRLAELSFAIGGQPSWEQERL